MAEVAPGGVKVPLSTGDAELIVTPSIFIREIAWQRVAASVADASAQQEIASAATASMNVLRVAWELRDALESFRAFSID
jgi:hypothetical protein